MDSHTCPLSLSSCEYLLRFRVPQSHTGILLFLIFALYISPKLVPGLPRATRSMLISFPAGNTVLFNLCLMLVSFFPFHSITSLLSTTEVYLTYVSSFPSPLSLTWIGLCPLLLELLQHLHFEAEYVQNYPTPNLYPPNKCASSVFSPISLKGIITK